MAASHHNLLCVGLAILILGTFLHVIAMSTDVYSTGTLRWNTTERNTILNELGLSTKSCVKIGPWHDCAPGRSVLCCSSPTTAVRSMSILGVLCAFLCTVGGFMMLGLDVGGYETPETLPTATGVAGFGACLCIVLESIIWSSHHHDSYNLDYPQCDWDLGYSFVCSLVSAVVILAGGWTTCRQGWKGVYRVDPGKLATPNVYVTSSSTRTTRNEIYEMETEDERHERHQYEQPVRLSVR